MPTDHDSLFKELLTNFFAEFLELFLPEVAAYVDRDSITFLDKELVDALVARPSIQESFSMGTATCSPSPLSVPDLASSSASP